MIITNHLKASQSAHAAALERLCKTCEALKGSICLSNELNYDTELPCFYLLYHPENPDELIALLFIFMPQPNEAEIYAYTSPAWRNRGCFNTLLEAALQNLWEYGIDNVLFVHEPASKNAPAVLNTLEADYQYSEYLLTLSDTGVFSDAVLPPTLLLLPAKEAELEQLAVLHALAFQEETDEAREFLAHVFSSEHSHVQRLLSSQTGELVGMCCYTIGSNEISIFSVAIHPAQQKKGYASAMLKSLIRRLSHNYPKHPITLEVNSKNTPAFSLYQKLGFRITTQFDYSLADCGALLALFS